MSEKNRISRRTFLRGMGTAIALPFLDAMMPSLGFTRRAWGAAPAAAPVRMGFIYVPNGVNVSQWTPATTGTGYTLANTLSPLAPYKGDLSVLSELANAAANAGADGAGDHARGAATFLTSHRAYKTGGSDINVGISVDQVAALSEYVGGKTPFPSLELGIESGSNSGSCDSGYSCAYQRNIAWRSATTPTARERSPQAVFDRLFGAGSSGETTEQKARRREYSLSVLDFVLEDARRLQSKLGHRDKQKLDEYLTGVREVEKRVSDFDAGSMSCTKPARPDYSVDAIQDHVDLQLELLAIAFICDLTRVGSIMLADEGSYMTYPVSYNGSPVIEGHHDITHHGGDPVKLGKVAAINKWHVERFAKFIKKLKDTPEGAGTVLDNSMIVYGGGISDGDWHNHNNLPILLAGKGGGTIGTAGSHKKFATNTPISNLWVAMLNRAGVPTNSFGDSTGELSFT
jgi:hypothetical protein